MKNQINLHFHFDKIYLIFFKSPTLTSSSVISLMLLIIFFFKEYTLSFFSIELVLEFDRA